MGTGRIISAMPGSLDFIVRNGWPWRAVSRASAFEVKPGSQEQQRFNETLVEGSSGQLGAITHELKVVIRCAPQVEYVERCVDAPQVQVQECVRRAPQVEYLERCVDVPHEKVVECPEVRYIEKVKDPPHII